MTLKPIKCPHCQKIFFDSESENCPFCRKSLKEDLSIFRNLFGEDSPFDTFFNGEK